MEGVEWVESSAMPSLAVFHLKFEMGTAMDVALERVRGKVQGAKKDLPAEVKDPEAVKASTAFFPQMVVAVVGNRSDSALTDAAKKLKNNLATVPGVAGIDLRGEQTPAIRVRLDPVKLANHHLSMDDVAAKLRLANIRVPGGELKVGPLLTLLQIDRDLSDAESVMKVVIASHPDEHGVQQTVVLGDVADVREAPLALSSGSSSTASRRSRSRCASVRRRTRSPSVLRSGSRLSTSTRASCRRGPRSGSSTTSRSGLQDWSRRSSRAWGKGCSLAAVIIITLGMGWRAASVVAGCSPARRSRRSSVSTSSASPSSRSRLPD